MTPCFQTRPIGYTSIKTNDRFASCRDSAINVVRMPNIVLTAAPLKIIYAVIFPVSVFVINLCKTNRIEVREESPTHALMYRECSDNPIFA